MTAYYADGQDGTTGQLRAQSTVFAMSGTYTAAVTTAVVDDDTIEFMTVPAGYAVVGCSIVNSAIQTASTTSVMDVGTAASPLALISDQDLKLAGFQSSPATMVGLPALTTDQIIIGTYDTGAGTLTQTVGGTITVTVWLAKAHG